MLISDWQKVKYHVLLIYEGPEQEHAIQLCILRKNLERKHPKLKFWFAFPTIHYEVFKNQKNTLDLNKIDQSNFGATYNLKFNLNENPILKFFKENEIDLKIEKETKVKNQLCLILKENNSKSKKINDEKLNNLMLNVKSEGFSVVEGCKLSDVGAVAGVGSAELYAAAYLGLKTFIVKDKDDDIFDFMF